jgi:hypothetical protein
MVEGISLRPHGLSWLEAALESEFETVQRWGEISATLIKLTLPSTTHWARLFDNVWFPGNPSKDCPETVHCLKWLIKKVLTSPELPKEYRLLADGVGGAHEMAALKAGMDQDGIVPAFDIRRREDGRTAISFPPYL